MFKQVYPKVKKDKHLKFEDFFEMKFDKST